MLEDLSFLLKRNVFIGLELCCFQLLELEAHPFLLRGMFSLQPIELLELITDFRPLLIDEIDLLAEGGKTPETIQRRQMGFGVHQQLVLMLPGNGYKTPRQLLKLLQGHLLIVHIDPVATATADAPPNIDFGARLQFQFRESGIETGHIREQEFRLNHSFVCPRANHFLRSAAAQDQIDRTDEDRFPCAGFPGDNVQPFLEGDLQVSNDGKVVYQQFFEHVSVPSS